MQQNHKLAIDKCNTTTYNSNINTKGGDEVTKTKEIELTDDTLENIKIMAPHLTEKQQHIAFGVLLGIMAQDDKAVGDSGT